MFTVLLLCVKPHAEPWGYNAEYFRVPSHQKDRPDWGLIPDGSRGGCVGLSSTGCLEVPREKKLGLGVDRELRTFVLGTVGSTLRKVETVGGGEDGERLGQHLLCFFLRAASRIGASSTDAPHSPASVLERSLWCRVRDRSEGPRSFPGEAVAGAACGCSDDGAGSGEIWETKPMGLFVGCKGEGDVQRDGQLCLRPPGERWGRFGGWRCHEVTVGRVALSEIWPVVEMAKRG